MTTNEQNDHSTQHTIQQVKDEINVAQQSIPSAIPAKKKKKKKKSSSSSSTDKLHNNDHSNVDSTSSGYKLMSEIFTNHPVLSLKYHPSRGRYCIARRLIRRGELLHSESPYAIIIRSKMISEFCSNCAAPVTTTAESHNQYINQCPCNSARFCSDQCFIAARPLHRIIDTALVQIKDIARKCDADVDLLHLMLQVYGRYALECNGELAASDSPLSKAAKLNLFPNKQDENKALSSQPFRANIRYEHIRSLDRHKDALGPDWQRCVLKASEELIPFLPSPALITAQEFVDCAAMINSNSHGLITAADPRTPTGLGVYPLFSMVNHSCDPNVVYYTTSKGTIDIYAMRDIQKDEEVSTFYIDLYQSRSERQDELFKSKQFICKCKRCKINIKQSIDRIIGGMICQQCRSKDTKEDELGVIVYTPPSSFICTKCDSTFTREEYHQLNQSNNALYQLIIQERRVKNYKKMATLAEQWLEQYGNCQLFHPLHTSCLQCYVWLLTVYKNYNDYQNAIKWCKMVIYCMEHVMPYSAEIAGFYKQLGELIQSLTDNATQSGRPKQIINALNKKYYQDQINAFEHAKDIYKTCFGENHPNVIQTQQLLNKLNLKLRHH